MKFVALLGVADGAGNPLEFVGIDVDEPSAVNPNPKAKNFIQSSD
jgi:hypothetical protein